MEQKLVNFIKYCLGYIRLTRERTVISQQKYSVNLPKEHFSIAGLLNGDADGSLAEIINLDTFYSYDPKQVPKNKLEQYAKEKELANRIEDIYSKYRNDQFTKQIVFSFGYFEVELPVEADSDILTLESDENEDENDLLGRQVKVDHYPLFTIPIKIEKEITKQGVGKYSILSVDPEMQVNIGMLEPILGEDLYFQLLEEMGAYEMEGQLTLPINGLDIFTEIWHKIKAQLRLKNAKFDEDSFSLEEIKIALSPKANYFLAEDLAKLAKLPEEELRRTALTSWTDDDDLNNESDLPNEQELYFPFSYDKYQLAALSIINNKASIIQGPPGTGKSETISNILCHLAANGKRVLFVSQKAQALKVVKDKLKKLKVQYLFGYLPNPSSAQIGEDDESDGIAPQLSALGAHIEKLGYKIGVRGKVLQLGDLASPVAISKVVNEKNSLQSDLNISVQAQRVYCQLFTEFTELKQYRLDINDLKLFESNFSVPGWQELKKLEQDIYNCIKSVQAYETCDSKKEMEKILVGLDVSDKTILESVGTIKHDVDKTGYDRHFNLLRRINNTIRNNRLRKIRGVLPREIIDYIDIILNEDISRHNATKRLDNLCAYCKYHTNISFIEENKNLLQRKFEFYGISDLQYKALAELIGKNDPGDIKKRILRVYEIESELKKISDSKNLNEIIASLKRIESRRRQHIALYLQNIIDKNITQKWISKSDGLKVRQIVQQLAKAFGKSKKAFKTFDNLRKEPDKFNVILNLIPIWIMELDDASRIIPLNASIFDYVILDEASQCNVAYTLPVMFRSKRVLFVGDSEQMRDSTIIFKSNRVFDELAHRYQIPEDRQIKSTGATVQSVLDIAKNRGFLYRTLHYHYRSPKELIGFSNKYFYKPNGKDLISLNSNYLSYNDTNRIMVIHEIQSDWNEEFSDKVNIAEAKQILKLFSELRESEKYKDKSIGILCFFNAQATYIRELFEQSGLKEEKDNYKVSIIEGIQGDEKDIVIYSFVIRSQEQKNKYVPLTGEGGDIRADINRGRVNVAFSRARLQVHSFISMPISQIPERIWLKKYLEYVKDCGEVSFHSSDMRPFDSYFEEDFYNFIRSCIGSECKIQNQLYSCGFKIDFVISNINSGRRIAVECDGPTHFKNEIDEAYGVYIENDEERQRVLESAGWRFYRLKYSDWLNSKFDRNEAVSDIEGLLK
jgi:very-short-patch-repair endonuclease